MPPAAYTRTAIAFHWLVALFIFAAFALGLYMADLALSPQKLRLYSYHKWLGVTIFMLVLARLAWRLSHPVPALPVTLPRWQNVASKITHVALYALMVVIPLSGWLYSSAAGVQTVYLGLLPLPNLVVPDKALATLLRGVHWSLNVTLFVIFCVHTGAALKHHFIDRDGVLARMLPFLDRKPGA